MRRMPHPVGPASFHLGRLDTRLNAIPCVIERPLRVCDRARVFLTRRAFDGIPIANAPMRVARGSPHCDRGRVTHKLGRECVIGKSAAPARCRSRLLLHPTATALSRANSSASRSSSATASPDSPSTDDATRTPNSSPQAAQAPRLGSSS